MKYIVYCTRNNKNAKIYIGVHGTETPHSFDGYIGNGLYTYNKKFKVNTSFKKAVKKYGAKNFIRTTLAVCDTKEEAYKKEEKFVDKAFIRRKDTYNMIVGGVCSATAAVRIAQYDLDGNFIKVFDSITEAARIEDCDGGEITKCAKGHALFVKQSQWRYVEDELKTKIEAVDGKKKRKIIQYSKVGYKKKTWNSITEAAKHFNCAPNTIGDVCKGKEGKRTAKGYQWRYAAEAIESLPPIN